MQEGNENSLHLNLNIEKEAQWQSDDFYSQWQAQRLIDGKYT